MRHEPCKTCISYAICRTKMITSLPRDYKTMKRDDKQLVFVSALSYYVNIETRCEPMCDFIAKELSDVGRNNYQHDLVIHHIMCESLDL